MTSILARIAAGDPGAVEECMDRYGGLVWTLARRWSASDADAEDAVQEVFLTLWKNASRFDETKSSEKTFITMITRRRLIDRIRHSKRRPQLQAFPEDGPDPSGRQHQEMQLSAEAAQADRFEYGARSVFGLVLRHALDERGHRHVFERVELRQEVVELEDEADGFVPKRSQRR